MGLSRRVCSVCGPDIPHPQKRLLTVFFSSSGFKVIEILPNGATVDTKYFCTIIDKLAAAAPGHLFLHMDNAAPHRARLCQIALERKNITRLPHPAYSPDLAPADFWLFGLLKGRLAGKSFQTEEELHSALCGEIDKISRQDLRGVFNEWKRRLEKCIESGGEFVHISE